MRPPDNAAFVFPPGSAGVEGRSPNSWEDKGNGLVWPLSPQHVSHLACLLTWLPFLTSVRVQMAPTTNLGGNRRNSWSRYTMAGSVLVPFSWQSCLWSLYGLKTFPVSFEMHLGPLFLGDLAHFYIIVLSTLQHNPLLVCLRHRGLYTLIWWQWPSAGPGKDTVMGVSSKDMERG